MEAVEKYNMTSMFEEISQYKNQKILSAYLEARDSASPCFISQTERMSPSEYRGYVLEHVQRAKNRIRTSGLCLMYRPFVFSSISEIEELVEEYIERGGTTSRLTSALETSIGLAGIPMLDFYKPTHAEIRRMKAGSNNQQPNPNPSAAKGVIRRFNVAPFRFADEGAQREDEIDSELERRFSTNNKSGILISIGGGFGRMELPIIGKEELGNSLVEQAKGFASIYTTPGMGDYVMTLGLYLPLFRGSILVIENKNLRTNVRDMRCLRDSMDSYITRTLTTDTDASVPEWDRAKS